MITEILFFLTELPPGRVFGLDSQTFISILAHLVNISILAFILAKVLYNPVRNFMQNRANRIGSQLNQAKEELERANVLKLEYEQKIKTIESERDEILETARKEAAESTKRTLAEAKKEADDILARAKTNIDHEWERNRAQMRLEIIDISADMTEKYLKRAIDKDTLDRLFAETMEELGEMAWRN